MATTIDESKKFKERALNSNENYEQVLQDCINYAKEFRKKLEDKNINESACAAILCDHILNWETIEYSAYDAAQPKYIKVNGKNILNDKFYIKDILKQGLKPKGNVMIGPEFNMDAEGSSDKWENINRRIHRNDRIPFHKVYKGELELVRGCMFVRQMIHKKLIENRFAIETQYGYSVWARRKLNEKFAIEYAYYCKGPKLVGKYRLHDKEGNLMLDENGAEQTKTTNFLNEIKAYDEALPRYKFYDNKKDKIAFKRAKLHLNYARWELKYNSNPEELQELDKRCYFTEVLLDTYNDPLLTKDEILKGFAALEEEVKQERKEAYIKAIKDRVKGFINLIQELFMREVGRKIFLTEDDVLLIKSRAEEYLLSESNQDLQSVGKPIFDKIDNSSCTEEQKTKIKKMVRFLVGYLGRSKSELSDKYNEF